MICLPYIFVCFFSDHIVEFLYGQYPTALYSSTSKHAQPYAPLEYHQHHSSDIHEQYTHHRSVVVVRPLFVRPAELVKSAKLEKTETPEQTDQTSSSPSASANATKGGDQPDCSAALLDMDYRLLPKDMTVLSSTNTGNSAEKNQKVSNYLYSVYCNGWP